MSTRPVLTPLALVAALAMSPPMSKTTTPPSGIRNIVLVHGAFADGSSYAKVIPLLLAQGYHVTAVQNPLSSLADDVAATKRAIALQDGPLILVGHSYAGMVITETGSDPKVAGLVYIAAFAPDVGQSVADLGKGYPAPPGGAEVKPDAGGWLSLTRKGIDEDFVPELPPAERDVVYATQGQWNSKAISEKVTTAAWKTKPSWFIVVNDRMIAPEYEKAVAAQIHAKTTTLNANHVAMLSHPREVAAVIIDAATNATARSTAR